MKTSLFPLIISLFALVAWGAFASAEEAENGFTDEERLALVEFRSVMTLDGRTRYSLYDPTLDRSFWVEDGQVRHGFTVENYQEENRTIVVVLGEFEREVEIATSQVATLEESEAPEAGEGEERRRGGPQQRGNRPNREEVERLSGVLAEAMEESERLQEIRGAYVELMRDVRRLRRDAREVDRNDPAFDEVLDLRRELGQEFRNLAQSAQEELGNMPNISAEDREALANNFPRLLWHQHRQERQAERQAESQSESQSESRSESRSGQN